MAQTQAQTQPEALSLIHDKRSAVCFKKTTFSNYAIKDVVRDFATKVTEQNIQTAQHWAAELICSGACSSFIETTMDIYASQIGTANSRMPAYLLQRIAELRAHTATLATIDPLQIRNDTITRKHVCEIVGVLCLSAQKKAMPKPSITTVDFHMDNIARRRRTTSGISPVNAFLHDGDPDECVVPLTEWYDALTKRDTGRALYWLYWLWEWDAHRRKTAGGNVCAVRAGFPEKLSTDIVWLLCEIIMSIASTMDAGQQAAPRACLEMFRREYCASGSMTTRRRRFALIQIAVQFVTERPVVGKLVENAELLAKMVNNVDNLYTEIRKANASLPTTVVTVGSGTTAATAAAKKKKEENVAQSSALAEKLDLVFSVVL